MKEIGVGILGFGTVGAGVADGLLKHRELMASRTGVDIVLRKIDTRERTLTDSAPISLYNIEYTPKLISRRTTGYARTRKNPAGKIN